MRYFLDIAYRGSSFHGWQVQPNAHTVQEVVNEALSTILREPISCMGSGRTDTGVHALQQIAHFDIDRQLQPSEIKFKLNSILPKAISVQGVYPVIATANARFDATSRAYQYHIHRYKNPFLDGLSYYYSQELDVQAIEKALELIRTHTDFQAFSRVHTDVKHFNCQIFDCSWKETNEGYIFSVKANRFLRGMVRAMVGTLLLVGQNKLDVEGLKEVLASLNRSAAGRAVPPEGLYLCEVNYPDSIYLDS